MASILSVVAGGREFAVVADHRERASGVPAALEALGVPVRTTTLRAGDYAIGSSTRIERKTVRDLHESVISGRFWKQLNRLRAVSAFPMIVVEGLDLDSGRLPPNGIRGVVVALLDRGVPVIRTTDEADTARWIRSIAMSRSGTKRIQLRAPYRRPIGRRDPVTVAMLSALPTVSLRNARDLVDAFGTLRRIANADANALRAVSGIGPRRAQAIVEAFNEHF